MPVNKPILSVKRILGIFIILYSGIIYALPEHSPWINDNPEHVHGHFGEGLKFDFWRSRLFLKTPGLMSAKEGTIQFWLNPCRDINKINYWATILSAGTSKRQETRFTPIHITLVPPHKAPQGKGRLGVGIASNNSGRLSIPIEWNKGVWYAIAMTWGEHGMEVYINGKLMAATKDGPVILDEVPEYLSFGGGTCKRFEVFADCILDAIEISDCVRPASYIKDFAKAENPPVPDAHSTALYLCDKSSAKGYWKMTDYYRTKNVPSAIWGSGFFDDYGTFPFGSKPDLPFTLVNPNGNPIEFTVVVAVKDFNGNQCGEKSAVFNVEPGKIKEAHFTPDISKPGWYSYRISIMADGKYVTDETHSFVILPKIPACAMDDANYFGNHLCGTRKTDFFTQAGIPWERDMVSFSWIQVQPERGVWDWRAGDFIVQEAKKNGMKLIGILGHPAAWAATDDISRWKKPMDFSRRAPKSLEEFSEYVYKTVSRYKNDVKYWEIWNEPDWNRPEHGSCAFSGTDAEYQAVLKTAYEAAKKADPDCVVVSGGFVPHEHQIKYLVENGGVKYFDILGMHRYRPWDDLEKYAKMIGKPTWQTERLVSSPEDVASDTFSGLKYSFEKCFFQDANTSCMTHFNVGKFDAYGWEPQPVYFAMANVASKIGGRKLFRKIELDRMNKVVDCFLFDEGKTSQVIAVHFNYSGPNKLKISFIPDADGVINASGIMGDEIISNAKRGVPLTVEVNNVLFLEGPIDPHSLRVASFEEMELLQNADFKLLEGDIGIDKLEGMRPKGWHLEKEKGSIGMFQLIDGAYAVDFKNPDGCRGIRISQNVMFANPGHYTLSAEFMNRSGNPTAFLSLWDPVAKKSPARTVQSDLPPKEWNTCFLNFRIDGAKKLGIVMGLDRGDGELLLRNPRLSKSIDPNLMKKTVFINLEPYANQSFDDETANDGKGGWVDLGQTNLSLMQTGLRDFGTELFKISESGKSCIMLGSGGKTELPPSVADIAVGAKLETLNFLCTALFVKAKIGERIGDCVVSYTDGSSIKIPFVRGKDIDDWFPPLIGKDVIVAETIRIPGGGERTTFITNWTNPEPDKEIKTITFKSAENALWAVIAVSGLNTEEKLLPAKDFTSGWKSWISPKARDAGATVKLDSTAKIHSPLIEGQRDSDMQLINPVMLDVNGLYCLKVTISSDSEGKLSGEYGLAKAPYASYCRFSINVKMGKHSYHVVFRPQPDKTGKYGDKRVLRLFAGGFENSNLELSDISIQQQ